MRTLLIAAVVLGGSAMVTPLSAQDARASGTRGLAWVGCWESADGMQAQGRVCVIPEGDRDLRIVSFDLQDKSTESTLRLNGERIPVSAQGCTGWEQARVSADGERILVDARLQCGDAPQQTISEVFVITPTGFWLQARGVGVAMVVNARVRVYRAVDSYASFPADIRAALVPRVQEAEYARNAMTERHVSARDLAELESMGVATPLIDLVVAASYPGSFVIDAGGTAAATRTAGVERNASSMYSNPFYWSNGFPMLSYYDLAMMENCLRFRMLMCGIGGGQFGFDAFGRGGFGYDRYFGGGYYGGFGWGAGTPVVVRPASPPSDYPGNRGGGRAVSGSGYTSGNSGGRGSGTRSAAPRSGNEGTSQNSGSAGSSSSSGSGGSSTAGSSGGSETRTAKPRTP